MNKKPMNNTRSNQFLAYLAFFSLLGGAGLIFASLTTIFTHAQATHNQQASAIEAITPSLDFSNVQITAKAAYVYDVSENKVLFAKNETVQLPLASIAKVPLILLAHKYLDEQALVTVSITALAPEGDWGFKAGDSWRTRDLIDYTLMTSSNDGAAMLAEHIEAKTGESIVTLLNEQAESIGLTQTFFLNETGLDSNLSLSGAYGSAQDVATLLAYAYMTAPDVFSATTRPEHSYTNSTGEIYKATNTNKVIGELPGLVLGKTGFTDLAGGNLAVITESEPGHPFVIVVLASTIDDRFEDVVDLSHATLRTPLNK